MHVDKDGQSAFAAANSRLCGALHALMLSYSQAFRVTQGCTMFHRALAIRGLQLSGIIPDGSLSRKAATRRATFRILRAFAIIICPAFCIAWKCKANLACEPPKVVSLPAQSSHANRPLRCLRVRGCQGCLASVCLPSSAWCGWANRELELPLFGHNTTIHNDNGIIDIMI